MFAAYRPLFPHIRPWRHKIILGALCAILYGLASGAGLPLLSQTVLPIIFQSDKDPTQSSAILANFSSFLRNSFGSDLQRLTFICCLFIPLIFLVRAVSGYLGSILLFEAGTRTIESFRNELFRKILKVPMEFFGKRPSGDILARLTSDSQLLQQSLIKTLADMILQPFVLISAFGILVFQATQKEGVFFALVGGLSIPLLVVPIRKLGKKLRKKGRQMQNKLGELTGMASEVIQNPLEVRAYQLENRFDKVFSELAEHWRELEVKVARYGRFVSPMVEVVAATGFTVALYLGAQKGMSLEDFLFLATALFMCYEPVKKLGSLHGVFEQSKAAIERVNEVLGYIDTQPDLAEEELKLIPDGIRGEIEFEEVRFRYEGVAEEEEVLRGVSLQISAGDTVALVGASGGGKTTFANLLPRFYDVTSGTIRIDGVDVRSYRKKDLRAHIALVPQMPVLFRGTIRENILMGRPSASEAEVEEAAKQANAHDFILRQSDGYETMVAERGGSLSGGQRQRVAIARAFLRDAPILILDEATSALDSESEAKVAEAVSRLAKGRTTLYITHRASTAEKADRIFRFEKGKVSEEKS